MTWTFIWLMFLLKIPIGGLLWIVWWAIHQTDGQAAADEGDGGSKVHAHRMPRPRLPPPRPRGAHSAPPPGAPARVRRATTARICILGCQAASARSMGLAEATGSVRREQAG